MNKVVVITSLVIAIIIIVVVTLIWWAYDQDPYQLLHSWNRIIDDLCTIQDSHPPTAIPSMYRASAFHLSNIRDLHRLVSANHDRILKESLELMNDGGGVPMIDMDMTQSKFFGQDGWRPLWVKFFNGWAPTANRLPTLKSIADEIPGLVFLSVSVLHPGTELSLHTGISRSVHRYHYGLQIPKGNLGLRVEGKYYRWVEGEGIVWDDTLLHEAWNKSDQPRLIVMADVKRDLGFWYNLGTDLAYWIVSKTRDIASITKVLEKHSKLNN